MRRLVLGVIGHVDHGKTALVRALTGMETDRLEEERRRGISIALGFAHFTAGDAVIDLIDMPGHERFVRTMIAGATGIDAALLVVAANEAVMPQTVEHVEIAALLGIGRVVVAVTKCDLVPPARVAAAKAAARGLAEVSGLSVAASVPTSALRGEGIGALRDAILAAAAGAAPPEDSGFPYLPADRAFSVAGHGTIVTGTLRRGAIRTGDALELVPSGAAVRVRGLQVHGAAVAEALPGQRVAVNLRGVEAAALPRGEALAVPALLRPAEWLAVALRAVESAPAPLATGTRLRLLHGTAETEARLRMLDRDALAPGTACLAQLQCRPPVAIPARERFVLRAASPPRTLAGGVVLDPEGRRLRRGDAAMQARLARLARQAPAETVAFALETEGRRGVALGRLARLSGLAPSRVAEALAALPAETLRGGLAVLRPHLEEASRLVLQALARAPDGLSPERLRAALPADLASPVLEEAFLRLAASGRARREGGTLRAVQAGEDRARAARQEEALQRLTETLREAGLTPPELKDVLAAHRLPRSVLERLTREGVLVHAVDRVQKREFLFHREAIRHAQRVLEPGLAEGGGMLVKEAGAALGISRKYSVPLLEYFDAVQYTRRVEDRRVLMRPKN